MSGCSVRVPLDGSPPRWKHAHPEDEPCPLAGIPEWLAEPEQLAQFTEEDDT
jgi:hypothetical protein